MINHITYVPIDIMKKLGIYTFRANIPCYTLILHCNFLRIVMSILAICLRRVIIIIKSKQQRLSDDIQGKL